MKQFKKTFFFAFLLCFVTLGGVFAFGHKSLAQGDQIEVQSAMGGDSSGAAEQILALLQELNSIQLDDSIFTDPMFLGLKDFHIELTEEPKQRINPFAPIGQDAVIESTGNTEIPTLAPSKGTTAI